MERRFVAISDHSPVDVRSADDKTTINGLAAVYYDGTPATEFKLWDGAVERVMPGAFDSAIGERADVLGLWNHDMSLVLGRTSSGTMKLRSNKAGLDYEIDPPDTQAGRDLPVLLKRGDVKGSSFGFRVTKEVWRDSEDGKTEIRELHAVELRDVGPVTLPAYTSTTSGVRTVGDGEQARASHDAWLETRDADAADKPETEDKPKPIDPAANAKIKTARLAVLGLKI